MRAPTPPEWTSEELDAWKADQAAQGIEVKEYSQGCAAGREN